MWIIQSLLVLLTLVATAKAQCSILVPGGLPENQPLILNPATVGVASGFLYPNGNKKLEFAIGARVRLACSGNGNYFVNDPTKRNDLIAECRNKAQFKVDTVVKSFTYWNCRSSSSSEQRASAINTCPTPYSSYEIGFRINNDFIKLIELCHDRMSMSTAYTQFQLKALAHSMRGPKRGPWIELPEHPVSYDAQYVRTVMVSTFRKILGQKTNYVTDSQYPDRGHFAPPADFIYETQQRATCYYVNQAPQWLSCNRGNWLSLEKNVRKYAGLTNQDLTVYTGTHQIGQLSNAANHMTDLYLYYHNATTHSIPVPRFFWKVIYNEITQLGTAFVEINDPFLGINIPKPYQICKNPVENTRWDAWSSGTHKCSSYVCTVDELRSAVTTLPQFTVIGLLA